LGRPTFPFLREIVANFCEGLKFAEGLFTREELGLVENNSPGDSGDTKPMTRKEKISFLVKILSVVSILTGERHDIYVSPAKVLNGQEVAATHKFLQALASRACRASPNHSKEAADKFLAIGEKSIYRKGVRTRNTMVTIQAMFRGRLVRRGRDGGGAAPATVVALDVSDDELSLSLSLSEEEGLGGTSKEEKAPDPSTAAVAAAAATTTTTTTTTTSSPAKVYVGLDGKIKVAAKEKADGPKLIAEPSPPSSAAAIDEGPEVPPVSNVSNQKKSLLPKRSMPPKRIRNTRCCQKVDAHTSVELDNVQMTRDMSELHVKQLQHREAVEVYRKAEANLKVRVQRTAEKESELKKKETELKKREDRVTRVAENLRKQQHILRQKEDAIKADTNGRHLSSAAVIGTNANEGPKPPIDPIIAAEIKGLRRKLFRSERRVQRREDQIRALFKRLGRLNKLHQRIVEEAKGNASEEETDRSSSWLIERPTNRTSPHVGKRAKPKSIDKRKQRAPQSQPATGKCRRKEPNESIENHRRGDTSKGHCNSSDLRPTKPSVSFSPNVEVTRLPPPPPPSPVETPTITRRAAYMQQVKAEIVPLCSDKIRQSLSEEC